MIANFFNKTKPVVYFVLTLLLMLYYILANLIFNFESFSFLWLTEKVGVLLLIVAFISISIFIFKKNGLAQRNSYSTLLLVVLLGAFYESMFTSNIIVANILLLLGFRKVYSLKTITEIKLKLFDAGFWFGMAALFYSWSIVFVVLIYLALVIYERISLKNLVRPIIGVLTPIFIYFAYCLYFDNLNAFYNCWSFNLSVNYMPYNNLRLLLPVTVFLSAVLWAMAVLIPKVRSSGINVKRSWRLVLSHFILAEIIVIFAPVKNGSEILFVMFPLSVIISNFLRLIPSENFKNSILYLFLLISISVYFL